MGFQKPSHSFTKIPLKGLRTNNLKILFALSFTVFINTFGYAQDIPTKRKPIKAVKKPKAVKKDSATVSVDSLLKNKENLKVVDSVKNDSIKKPKELLSDIVTYSANGYVALNNKEKKIYLYDTLR